MSTIYSFNEKDYVLAIETHYFDCGWDVMGLVEDGNVSVSEADTYFYPTDVEDVEDVFVGNKFAHLVVKVENADGTIDLIIHTMLKDQFIEQFSEQVWAKFREDNYVVCPICGEKKAEFVAGKNCLGSYFQQFYCNAHNDAYIMDGARFVREGVLH